MVGHRLLSDKVARPHFLFLPRLYRKVVSQVVWWALVKLPGGIGRFLLCAIGRHFSRLRVRMA